MLDVAIDNEMIRFGERMGISFHRTLRIPEGNQTYPLPPGLGRFHIYRVLQYAHRLPPTLGKAGGGFIPMFQCEALWIGFNGASWKPNAVVVAVGGINALTGDPTDGTLQAEPQNYLVAPPQSWLDGINSERGVVRQFIALPLGQSGTLEAAFSGKEERGGIQITVYDPKPDRFPDTAPTSQTTPLDDDGRVRPMHMPVQFMGLGAGGRIKQKIYRDSFGIDTWDQNNFGHATLHIVNSLQFQWITGEHPPPTPVDADRYTEMGLPWFDLYDESMAAIGPSERLSRWQEDNDEATSSESPRGRNEIFPVPGVQVKIIGQYADASHPESTLAEKSNARPPVQKPTANPTRRYIMTDYPKMCFDKILPHDMNRPHRRFAIGDPMRAIIVIRKMWPNGSTLRVRFLEGTDEQKNLARSQAGWWQEFANLRFDFNDAPDAEIRIAFNPQDGAWSYVGTDCLSIPRDQPTMNLGFQDGGTSAHEFGHAIGLGHEHQNPEGGIQWNEDVVIRDLAGPPNFWTPDQTRHNVIEKYSHEQINGTRFDPDSIMLYAFPGTWTQSGVGTHANDVLSSLDQSFIASSLAYPKGSQPEPVELPVIDTAGVAADIGQPGEEDLFKFTASQADRYTIETGGQTDVVMKLFGPNSKTALVAEDDDGGQGRNSKIVADLAAGEYFVQIRHYNTNNGTGNYSISVSR